MRLALIIAIYKRHDLEKLVIERFIEQSKKFGFDVVIAGSEGEISKSLANGCHYIEVENFPVSNKHQEMINYCKGKYDGVMLFGSDNMVSDEYFELIKSNIDSEKVVGLQDLYFYSTKTKELLYWKGYADLTTSAGAGRYFSKSVLDKLDWKLWSLKRNRGLDSDCNKNLMKKGIEQLVFTMEESKVFLVDVKHSRSITSHAILECCDKQKVDIMAKKLSTSTAKKVKELEVVEKEQKVYESKEIVEFESNGSFKPLGLEIYSLPYFEAQLFVDKGYGKILD
jgi:hypothetical protein